MTRVVCVDLTKRYGPVEALRGVSLELAEGRVTGLLGPNGAGKSTLLRIVLGLVAPDDGVVRRDGGDGQGGSPRIGATVDGPAFYPWLTGRQNLRAILAPLDVTRAQVDDAIDRTGLASVASRRVAGYSSGMRQRLAIATAIAGGPPVVLLDEPTNGLDPAGFRELRELILAERARGAAVLFASHLLNEAAAVCDQVVVLSQGAVVLQGSVAELTVDGATLEEHFMAVTRATLA